MFLSIAILDGVSVANVDSGVGLWREATTSRIPVTAMLLEMDMGTWRLLGNQVRASYMRSFLVDQIQSFYQLHDWRSGPIYHPLTS